MNDFIRWKMRCLCHEVALARGLHWLDDEAVPLRDRFEVASRLLAGESFH